jgi:RimJ/RimL family protein N-acetyltransferase
VSTPAAATLRFSPLESDRFGLRVFRCDVESVDAAAIAAAIEHERVDVLILRVPARELGAVNSLASHALVPIVADTLVYYDIDLSAAAVADLDASVTLRPASRDDAALLARMSREIFAGYVSHYHANPLFAPDRILDGYAEWAARHVGMSDGSGAWLVERDGEIAGFSCYHVDDADGLATGVLNGILPAARGHGTYRGMLQAMFTAFAEMRLRRFEISTQVHNVAVQRVWTAHRLALRRASNTVHLNAMRGLARQAPAPATASTMTRC